MVLQALDADHPKRDGVLEKHTSFLIYSLKSCETFMEKRAQNSAGKVTQNMIIPIRKCLNLALQICTALGHFFTDPYIN